MTVQRLYSGFPGPVNIYSKLVLWIYILTDNKLHPSECDVKQTIEIAIWVVTNLSHHTVHRLSYHLGFSPQHWVQVIRILFGVIFMKYKLVYPILHPNCHCNIWANIGKLDSPLCGDCDTDRRIAEEGNMGENWLIWSPPPGRVTPLSAPPRHGVNNACRCISHQFNKQCREWPPAGPKGKLDCMLECGSSRTCQKWVNN